MQYYFNKIVEGTFEQAEHRVCEEIKAEGFGVLTEIDVQATLKKKLDGEFRKYKILGASNPPLAYQTLLAEDKIGILRPCNVIVQETASGEIEVAAVDPMSSMQAVQNPKLGEVAAVVTQKLRGVIDKL